MKPWWLVLHVSALLDCVLTTLPAPVKPFVNSTNFHNVLCWEPGPGTPPGTHYQVFKRVRGRQRWHPLHNSTTTCTRLHLYSRVMYHLMVQASHNHTLSANSSQVEFTPYMDTNVGPPHLSVAGCGNCIKINISMPQAEKESQIVDIQEFYSATFNILWRKKDVKEVDLTTTKNKSYILLNLEKGVEYCVRVHMKTHMNNNTEPSAWRCTFTSPVDQGKGPAVIGAVTGLLIFGIIMATVSGFGLHYAGLLCKLKAALPRGLNALLIHGHTLIPETTIPDQIIMRTQSGDVKKHHSPTTLPARTIESDSEVEDENENEAITNVYMDRDLELSSRETSCQLFGNVLESNKLTASGDSGGLTDTSAEVERLQGEFDQGERKAEGLEDSPIIEWGPPEDQDQVTTEADEIEEELQHFSGNVNLLSITLAAQEEEEEEEEEEDKEQIIESQVTADCLEPLLSSERKWTPSDTRRST